MINRIKNAQRILRNRAKFIRRASQDFPLSLVIRASIYIYTMEPLILEFSESIRVGEEKEDPE